MKSMYGYMEKDVIKLMEESKVDVNDYELGEHKFVMVDLDDRDLAKVIGLGLLSVILLMYTVNFFIKAQGFFSLVIMMAIFMGLGYVLFRYITAHYEIHFWERKIYKFEDVEMPSYRVPDPFGYRTVNSLIDPYIVSKEGIPYVNTKGEYIIKRHIKSKTDDEVRHILLEHKETGKQLKVEVSYEEYCTYLSNQHVSLSKDKKLYTKN